MNNYLAGKTEDEIQRAATFWFMAAEAYRRGKPVPKSIFLLSVESLTCRDIEDAQRLFKEYFKTEAEK